MDETNRLSSTKSLSPKKSVFETSPKRHSRKTIVSFSEKILERIDEENNVS